MKIIRTGTKYDIYDSSIETYDLLPKGTYSVCFNQNQGFFLIKRNDIIVNEKTYGNQIHKVDKVLASFNKFERSLGVILSGDKGIGKSLFAKRLCSKAIDLDIPVLVVDNFIPGISKFIASIDQVCIVLFDEFDKTFTSDDDEDVQSGMLSLFDGTDGGKKLYVVTCNQLYGLNDYLINRPGRFHYHFRFEYPSSTEIKEYLKDMVLPEYHNEINAVVSFSNKITLNYDCLRAIAFELNTGAPFKEIIADLNILNVEREEYNLYLHFKDGKQLHNFGYRVNLFDQDRTYNWANMYDENGNEIACLRFDKIHTTYDISKNETIIPAKGLLLNFSGYENVKNSREYRDLEISHLTFERCGMRSLHYTV